MPDQDELLDTLEDLFENGGEVPARVSNRMLLLALRKSYRASNVNREEIQRNLSSALDHFTQSDQRLAAMEVSVNTIKKDLYGGEGRTGLINDVDTLFAKLANFDKKLLAIMLTMVLLSAVIGWYTGVDLGFLSAIP